MIVNVNLEVGDLINRLKDKSAKIPTATSFTSLVPSQISELDLDLNDPADLEIATQQDPLKRAEL